MTWRLRVAVLAATALVSGGAVHAIAAPASVLRITGRTTAYADLTFAAATTLDQVRARITTKGSYAAWWIWPLGSEPTSKSPQAGGIRYGGDPGTTSGASVFLGRYGAALAPGRYRLVLATDGDTLVEVAAPGLRRSLTVAPTRRTASEAGTRELRVLPTGIVADEVRQPTVLPASALLVVSTMAVSSPGVAHRHFKSCVARMQAACEEAPTSSGETISPFRDHGVMFSALYYPGEYEPGPADTVHAVTATPGSTRATGFYTWIALP